jgi:uncharacterized RDD family membrane protein YckC
MTDQPRPDEIVTPEAVSLTVDVAGVGSRMIAAFLDSLIQGAILFLFAVLFVRDEGVLGVGGGGGIAIFLTVLFLVTWAYYPLFEGLGGGRTPGKRAQKLRVMRVDGQPVGWGPVVVRNLLRFVDFLPAYYAVGAITMLATKRSQRVGDLAAGTVVVRDRAAPTPAPAPVVSPGAAAIAPKLDTAGLREREYDIARSFLQRRASLDPGARAQLSRKIAEALRARVPDLTGTYSNDEEFIEAAVHAYRQRFAGEMPAPNEPPPYEPR